MKFPKQCRIHKIASSSTRYQGGGYVNVEIDDGKASLIATNGKALAVVPAMADEGDVSCLVPFVAIKAACGGSKKIAAHIDIDGVTSKAVLTDRSGHMEVFCTESKEDIGFPAWREVLPKSQPVTVLHINPKLLLELAQAMGSDEHVTLELPEQEAGSQYNKDKSPCVRSPIFVKAGTDSAEPGAYGVIMPISPV